MSLILDSGGISGLAGQRARLAELRQRGLWPPKVPAVVIAECLTGDHRRDFHENHLLRMCQILPVTEAIARTGALLRTSTGRASEISATDAIVVAFAVGLADSVIVTSDPIDLADLADTQSMPVAISRV
jgi:predicted nucleic acid-binding protein